ncbi:MAG: hypothetical protein K8S54_10470 [Spirochaetia bacterium]|nr:hypothetical protein [Spirochaetia bacterium]
MKTKLSLVWLLFITPAFPDEPKLRPLKKQTEFVQVVRFGEVVGEKAKVREKFYARNGIDVLTELEYSEYDGSLSRRITGTIDRVALTDGTETFVCFKGKCELSERMVRKMATDMQMYLDTTKYDSKGKTTYKAIIRIIDGQQRERIIYDRFGSVTAKIAIEGPARNPIRSRSFKPDGTLDQRCEYSYTNAGSPIETLCYSSFDRVTFKEEHKYDARGNEIEKITYSTQELSLDIHLSDRAVMEYDAENRLVILKTFSSLNEADKLYTYTYEYH